MGSPYVSLTPKGTYLDHHGLDDDFEMMLIDDDFSLGETEASASARPSVEGGHSVLEAMLNSYAYQRADGDGR